MLIVHLNLAQGDHDVKVQEVFTDIAHGQIIVHLISRFKKI